MRRPLLELRNLQVTFGERIRAVRGIDFTVRAGEIHAIVGESGSGKSVTARAILQLLPDTADVRWDGLSLDANDFPSPWSPELRSLRGRRIAMVFQEPAKHLNPAMTVGRLIVEALTVHKRSSGRQALAHAERLLDLVDLSSDVLSAYPHELSGGMKQRALIALAISCDPALLIADEPTTALDVTVQAQILSLLDRLRRELGMAIVLISHDLSVVQSAADYVSVMYAGKIVDCAPASELFGWPLHPYTELLLESIPVPERRGERLRAIPGRVPAASAVPSGCAFHPRCPIAVDRCTREVPLLVEYRERHRSACHRVRDRLLGEGQEA
jgi:oligopeptide/dipeptide ABC transporter ATP-binding protein